MEFFVQRRILTGSTAIVLSMMAAGQQAQAQQKTAAPATEAAETSPEEIIVTGRLRAERLQDAPLAVTALSGNMLAKQAIVDVQGISKMVPLMVVGRQVSGSGASIFLRGVGSSSLSSGFDQSVALNLDGIAMTRGREIINTQYDLAQVEVLKGPQALFFGKNSTGGVVSMTTANPGSSFEARVKAGYEFEANERYAEGVISGPLTDSFGARLAVRASKMDGYFENVAEPNVTNGFLRAPASKHLPYGSALSGRLTLLYDPGDGLTVSLKATGTHMKDSGVFYERRCGAGRTVGQLTLGVADPYSDCTIGGKISTATIPLEIARTMKYQRDDGETYDDHKSGVAALRVDKKLDSVTFTSITGYYAYKQLDANSFSGATLGIYSGQQTKYRQFTQEFRAITTLDGPLNATFGAFYANGKLNFNYDSLVFVDPVDPTTGRRDTFEFRNGFTDKTYSAFAEITYKLTPTIELAGGARYSKQHRDSYVNQVYVHPTRLALFAIKRLDDTFKDNNVSPQATITWKPNQDLTLYAAYKQGYKSGGFNTSIAVSPTTQVADGKFDAEKAKGGEIGVRTKLLDHALSLNVTAYSYDYDGLQVQVFNALTQAQTVQNVGTLRVRGIESEAVLDIPGVSGLQLRGAAAYNQAKFHDFLGTCYTGQTIAAGCSSTPNAAGVFQKQNLEGRTAPKAPKYALQLGANYDFPIFDALRLGLSGGAQYTSRYNFSDALRPDAYQPAFTRWDAAARLSNPSAGWELALVGRNLTNKIVVTSANDMPRQGGGTGTAAGTVGDLNTIIERGREIHLEFSFKF